MKVITQAEAHEKYESLTPAKRIVTLSPQYVIADAHRESLLSPTFLLCEQGDKFWLHSVHKGSVPGTDYSDFQSAYGYGGPVSNSDDAEFLTAVFNIYFKWCIENRILAEFVRLHPMASFQPFFGDRVVNRSTVYLTPFCQYSGTCRNKVRKALNEGLKVIELPSSEIARFGVSYREGMEKLKASQFYFFSDVYFEAMAEVKGARLLTVMRGDELLSAGIFLDGGEIVEYHLAVTSEKGREYAATNLLIAEAHAIASKAGKNLYLGGGKTINEKDPLLQFKSSFGGARSQFITGSNIFNPAVYYALLDELQDVGSVNPKTLFWRG